MPTRLENLEELARLRRLNREKSVTRRKIGLHQFVREAWEVVCPGQTFADNWHIEWICRELESVTETPDDKLLINVPPGTMKSVLVGVMWPAWVWGPRNLPAFRWLYASYGSRLSEKNAGDFRNLVTSEWFQAHWPLGFENESKVEIQNKARGWRISTSVGGAGTGLHPDVKIFDDPHSTVEAESAEKRKHAIEWWEGTMSTRGSAIGARSVGVMQRQHVDDLAGVELAKGGWRHVCLPMRFEPNRRCVTDLGSDPRQTAGELLWPSLWTEDRVSAVERTMGSLRAAGQLQQRPTVADGDVFRLEWLGRRQARWPVDARACRYWDTASTQGGGDFTVGVLMAEVDGMFYIADVVREQVGYRAREKLIYDTTIEDNARFRRPCEIWIERPTGLSGESTDRQLQQLAGYNARADKVTSRRSFVKGQDLPSRWTNLAAQFENGNIILIEGPWNGAFVDELLAAPNGSHDDQIVAAAGAFSMLTVKAKVRLDEWLKVI